MLIFLKISWRNVWRHPRRSIVIIAAMTVGLWGMLFALGFNHGMGSQMLENLVMMYFGHLQIHNRAFPSRIESASLGKFDIEHNIANPDRAMEIVAKNPEIKAWAPHLKTMGLITNAEKSSGVYIIGLNPELEANISKVMNSIVAGTGLHPANPRDILIGVALAKRLGVDVGSKVVIMAQDSKHQKVMVAFRVVGEYHVSSSDHEKGIVYVNLNALQDMLVLSGQINEIIMLAKHPQENIDAVQRQIQAQLDPQNEITQWKELWPALYRMWDMADVFTFIFFILVFIAMAFGIANTVLMAVFERIRELGIMKALGTRPIEIFLVISIECIFLSIIGIIVGTGLGLGTVFYFGKYGMNLAVFSSVLDKIGLGTMIYTKIRPVYILWGASAAFGTALLSSIWPAIKAARLLPVDAIHHV